MRETMIPAPPDPREQTQQESYNDKDVAALVMSRIISDAKTAIVTIGIGALTTQLNQLRDASISRNLHPGFSGGLDLCINYVQRLLPLFDKLDGLAPVASAQVQKTAEEIRQGFEHPMLALQGIQGTYSTSEQS